MFASRTVRGVKVPCVAVYIVCVLLIIVYGMVIRRTGTCDVLARRIYHHPICQDIDGWSATHLLFFGLLGVMYPGRHLQFLGIGILWEVIETALGQNKLEVSGKRLQLVGDQDADGNTTGDDDAYWYGKESDIVVDMVGYCLGSAWASRYWPDTPAAAPPRAIAPSWL
jgi:hypothetical protein